MTNRDEKAANILNKLALNEELVANLYKEYADTFPVLSEFWSSLTNEEINHASWIRSLGTQTGTRPIVINETRFNASAIQTFMDYLKGELARLKDRKIPLIEALSITLYTEQSLIENKFFEVFETDTAEFKQVRMEVVRAKSPHCH